MKYVARKPFRYGARIYLRGDSVPVKDGDVELLQVQGMIGRPIETASVKPPETAIRPKAEPKVDDRDRKAKNKVSKTAVIK